MFPFFEINSIRSRMVSGFLLLTIMILALAAVSILLFNRITRISRTHSNISQLQIYTLSLMKSDNDFFDQETINEEYFKTHHSVYLKRRDSLNSLISGELIAITQDEKNENEEIGRSLNAIDSILIVYNRKFRRLEELLFKKGFKDFGTEGVMRYHAHVAEQMVPSDQMLDLLYLRRHEKDFLLRSDTAYLSAFKNRMHQFLNELGASSRNSLLISHLKEYQARLLELADVQQELGLSSNHGLRSELNELTNSLSDRYHFLSEYSYSYTESTYHKVRLFYLALLLGAILFSILSALWISKKLSEPIARLSKNIQSAISSRNMIQVDLQMVRAAKELKALGHSFNLLIREVNTQMNNVTMKNNELEKTNRELDNFLYSTAHDLRSPLNSLLGLVNLMRKENTQENLKIYFQYMENSVHRSEHFISQIVAYSQNKKMGIIPEELDLEDIIEGIFENHQFIEGASRIRKLVTVREMSAFYSDSNRVIMILANLISNGIKYADFEKSEQFISISLVVTQEEVVIQYSDNGLGIESHHVKNIFDMFYRANNKSRGSGLGLFIFKETLNRLEGHATVESDFGAGTRFYIRIPNLIGEVVNQQQLEFEL